MASVDELRVRRLLDSYRVRGNLAARDELVAIYLPLVRALARRHGNRAEQLDDVVQVGALGLLMAIERFDPDRGRFDHFAVTTVVGELRRHFRDGAWPVRVPRRVQELRRALDEPNGELAYRLARSPRPDELAREVGVGEEDVRRALQAERVRSPVSLTSPAPRERAELRSYELGAVDDPIELCDDRVVVAAGLRRLDPRSRRIVHLRFFEGLSQAQIAREVQLSQIHVSRLLRDALVSLRAHMASV